MPISALLFDLDGTLLETERGILSCFRHTLEALKLPPKTDGELRRYIGPPLREAWRGLVGEGFAEQAAALYRECYDHKGKFNARPYEGILEALSQLSAHRLFVATSKRRTFALDMAEHFGLTRYFSGIYGVLPENPSEDKAALIARIVQDHRLNPRACLMVGDRMYDLIGASANGMGSVGVLWGYGSREELEAHHPTALCEHPSDLPNLIADRMIDADILSTKD